MTSLLPFFLFTGSIFGFLAALIVFLVTYIEWRKHRFEGWALWREPLVRAVFTFVFFFVLAALIGLFI